MSCPIHDIRPLPGDTQPDTMSPMHIHRGFLGWGVFFILLGAVPLAVQAGVLTAAQVADWWRFWPLILIGIGLGLLLRRTSFDAIGGLVVAATFGLMVGAAASTGAAGIGGFPGHVCGPLENATPFAARDGTFTSSTASVDIRLDCGDLTVASDDGAGWRVTGDGGSGAGPRIDADGSSLSVESSDAVQGLFDWGGGREDWVVTLPNAPQIDLDAQVNAGTSRMDLRGARIGTLGLQLNAASSSVDLGQAHAVTDVDVQLNAGSLGLTLPATGTTGSIEANAGSVKLCTPPGVALRLETDDSVLSSYDYAGHGLVQQGSTWATPGYDTAAVRIDLRTTGNLASFELDPAEGCGG